MTWAIWITGPPGSGKSTIARAVEAALRDRGCRVKRLELDEVRRCLTPAPRYSDAEREVVYRALGWLAALLVRAGVPVIVDATAHRRAWRDLLRRAVPVFAEIELACPLPVRRERESTRPAGNAPTGIYARAGQRGATVPGVDVPYESSPAAELRIDTGAVTVAESARRIAELIERLSAHAANEPPAPDESAGPAWALWVAGRPGSGKSTLVASVAGRLRASGARPQVLDLASVRRGIAGGPLASPMENDVLHRALAYGAKLLTEAGVPVIVDASAVRREWRELARGLIPAFAEVQLLCPVEVCLERERTVRWGLAFRGAGSPSEPASPDIEIDFEESQHAELTIRTDVEGVHGAAERVLDVARRLAPRPSPA